MASLRHSSSSLTTVMGDWTDSSYWTQVLGVLREEFNEVVKLGTNRMVSPYFLVVVVVAFVAPVFEIIL